MGALRFGPNPQDQTTGARALPSPATIALRAVAATAAIAIVVALLVAVVGQSAGRADAAGAAIATESASESPTQTTTATPSSTPTATPTTTPTTPTTPTPTVAPPVPVKVPSLRGDSLASAKRAIERAGLVVGMIVKVGSNRPKGSVIQQAPRPGVRVEPGSKVALAIAKPFPRIPSVVGMTKAAAVRALDRAGYTVRIWTKVVRSGRDGVVLQQSPRGRSRVEPGKRIDLTIAKLVKPKPKPQPAPAPQQSCTPGYSPCLPPASDYDCAGGSGNGPKYVYHPVRVTGSDPYRLDADGDGWGCE
ncbi:PASTA domain-containing protein [Nocardioides sp. R-C-SC26]|uniref:PASTA domain-containing protein n=1 Tax=Nocardioides sp. R-C-SC26 TaxID=2870414 RepID=UPI001E630F6B|nr:PASTA domain-containing protein [Nocardioides sp. R-C-SC26]